MDFYSFVLESFRIDNTRARHDDTDTVSLGLKTSANDFPTQVRSVGDVNNGLHTVGLKFGVVWVVSDDDSMSFSYEIFNGDASSVDLSSVNQDVLDKTTQLFLDSLAADTGLWSLSAGQVGGDVSQNANTDENPTYSPITDVPDWSDSFFEAAYDGIANFVSPDCDGYVAADGVAQRKKGWDAIIDGAGGQVFRHSMSYPGTESPKGCGSNSQYVVTWSVSRETLRGSMRAFLNSHGRKLSPGLRSLTHTAAG